MMANPCRRTVATHVSHIRQWLQTHSHWVKPYVAGLLGGAVVFWMLGFNGWSVALACWFFALPLGIAGVNREF